MKYSENEKQLCELGRKKYEPTLIANGFFSYKDCGHAWFRIQNGFVQNILLANMLPGYGLMVQIYYGVYPAYCKLPIPPGLSSRMVEDRVSLEVCRKYRQTPLSGAAELSGANSPALPERIIDVVAEVLLPLFNRLKTAEDIYEWHKLERRKDLTFSGRALGYIRKTEEVTELAHYLSDDLISEAIVCEDSSLLPSCLDWAKIALLRRKEGSWRSTKEDLLLSTHQVGALETGDREAFLSLLRERETKNLKKLERAMPGITMSADS